MELSRASSSARRATSSSGQSDMSSSYRARRALRIRARRAEPSADGVSTWARPSTGSGLRSTRPRSTRLATCRLTVLLSSPSRATTSPARNGPASSSSASSPNAAPSRSGWSSADSRAEIARARRSSDAISRSSRTKASWAAGVLIPGSPFGPWPPDDQRGALPQLRHQVAAVRARHRGGDRGLGGHAAGLGGRPPLQQLVHARLQCLDPRLELDDPLDPGEVDAVLLGQPLDLAQQGDVPGAVPPAAAGGPAGSDQPEPVVLPQRLCVHAGELGRHRDDEDGRVVGHRADGVLRAAHFSPPAWTAAVIWGRGSSSISSARVSITLRCAGVSRTGTATSRVTSRSPLRPFPGTP